MFQIRAKWLLYGTRANFSSKNLIFRFYAFAVSESLTASCARCAWLPPVHAVPDCVLCTLCLTASRARCARLPPVHDVPDCLLCTLCLTASCAHCAWLPPVHAVDHCTPWYQDENSCNIINYSNIHCRICKS